MALLRSDPLNQRGPLQRGGRANKAPGHSKVQDIEWIHTGCFYISGKVEGRPLQYLLDTGSTENVISRRLFNKLPGGIKARLKAEESTATMADGSGLLIYGYIELPRRVRTVQVNILFKVAAITDDSIL